MSNSEKKICFIFVFLCVVSFLGFSSLFIVNQENTAIVIQFGNIISKEPISPGLHYKIPFIHKVVQIDKRIRHLSSDSFEMIAKDQKRLIVNYFLKYRISDPIKFYRTSRTSFNLNSKISSILESAMRRRIGNATLLEVINYKRVEVMDLVESDIRESLSEFGVSVEDVRIQKTDLPIENSKAVFKRMQTEREKEAREIRATGMEEGVKIRAEADKNYNLIIANANRDANIIIGEGELKAMKIYADMSALDKDFFYFYRKLITYSHLKSGNNKFVINISDNSFMDLFVKGVEK